MGATFDQIADEATRYADEHVTLEIVDLVVPGTLFQASEAAQFRVKISNSGPLHMTDVTLLLEGRNGALVSSTQGSFDESVESDEYPTIEAHDPTGERGQVLDVPFLVLAPNTPQPEQNLVKVSLNTWNLNFDHPLRGHTDPQPDVKVTWRAEVHPRT